jgi:hypothetical protein
MADPLKQAAQELMRRRERYPQYADIYKQYLARGGKEGPQGYMMLPREAIHPDDVEWLKQYNPEALNATVLPMLGVHSIQVPMQPPHMPEAEKPESSGKKRDYMAEMMEMARTAGDKLVAATKDKK